MSKFSFGIFGQNNSLGNCIQMFLIRPGQAWARARRPCSPAPCGLAMKPSMIAKHSCTKGFLRAAAFLIVLSSRS